jgi:hypothetical protein
MMRIRLGLVQGLDVEPAVLGAPDFAAGVGPLEGAAVAEGSGTGWSASVRR